MCPQSLLPWREKVRMRGESPPARPSVHPTTSSPTPRHPAPQPRHPRGGGGLKSVPPTPACPRPPQPLGWDSSAACGRRERHGGGGQAFQIPASAGMTGRGVGMTGWVRWGGAVDSTVLVDGHSGFRLGARNDAGGALSPFDFPQDERTGYRPGSLRTGSLHPRLT